MAVDKLTNPVSLRVRVVILSVARGGHQDARTNLLRTDYFPVVSCHSRADTSCADPAQLAHVGVSIVRIFDDAERSAKPDVVGIRGTAWFLSPTLIVTAGHVADAMRLSMQDWKPMEITGGDHRESMPARIRRLVGAQPEKLAVIELQAAVSGARSVEIRTEPLVPDEKVVTFANPDGRPRLVNGGSCNSATASSRAPHSSKCSRATIA